MARSVSIGAGLGPLKEYCHESEESGYERQRTCGRSSAVGRWVGLASASSCACGFGRGLTWTGAVKQLVTVGVIGHHMHSR